MSCMARGFSAATASFMFTHYLGNRIVTLATNILYNTMLTDMETCYKVMRTRCCDR